MADVMRRPFRFTRYLTILSDNTYLFIGYESWDDDCVFIRTTEPRVNLHTIIQVSNNIMDFVHQGLFTTERTFA